MSKSHIDQTFAKFAHRDKQESKAFSGAPDEIYRHGVRKVRGVWRLWRWTYCAWALLLVPIRSACAVTYYVDSAAGNDANSGFRAASAWRSLEKLNGTTFRSGAHTPIQFHRVICVDRAPSSACSMRLSKTQ